MTGNQSADRQRAAVVVGAIAVGQGDVAVDDGGCDVDGVFKIARRIQSGDDRLIIDWIDIDSGHGGHAGLLTRDRRAVVVTGIRHRDSQGAVAVSRVVGAVVVGDATQQALKIRSSLNRATSIRDDGEGAGTDGIAHQEAANIGAGMIAAQRKRRAANRDDFAVAIQHTSDNNLHLGEIEVIHVGDGRRWRHRNRRMRGVAAFSPGDA